MISSEEFLSASNDATVRRWSRTGDCLGTFYGHENYIYSVALLSSSATQVKKKISVLLYIVIHYHGQKDRLRCQNFIKIVILYIQITWVTSSEDRSVRVWEEGEVVQTLYLPAISVWSVCVLWGRRRQ